MLGVRMDDIRDDMEVRRKVFEAARHVEALAGNPAFHFAEIVRDGYRRGGESDKAGFWQDVRDYLFWLECAPKGSRIIIVEDE
jgi:hypothetical protein